MLRLEDQWGRVETTLNRIEERLRRLELDVAEVKGRVYALPGIWAMIATMIGGQLHSQGWFWPWLRGFSRSSD